MDIAITSIAGAFPGAPDVNRYWDNILNARVARLAPIHRYWNVPKERYFDPRMDIPNRAYLNDYFPLEENYDLFTEIKDRQVRIGANVVGQLLGTLERRCGAPDLGRMALSCGTAWTAESYFSEDEKAFFNILLNRELECGSKKEIFSAERQIQAIADLLGMKGPCLSVETACASSLYALDAGVGLLETGQVDSVVVLGLNAYLFPFLFMGFSKLKALATDGICRPLSAHASGVVFGEAVGAILIEPLSQALREGRPVLGVLKSIGLSSDGAERSPFAPGTEGQLLALERAYQGLKPEELDYIEAHGTATKLGDETELKVLDRFFRARCQDKKIPIGSIKALIGHTLAAAAISSLIKCILILNKKIIPPHIRTEPNPLLEGSCFYLPGEPARFNKSGTPMKVGVSSFGFGGTNAHAVLESYEGAQREKRGHSVSSSSKAEKHALTFGKRKFEPIAIVDMEAAFGHMIGGGNIQKLLAAKECAHRPFPWQRFNVADLSQVRALKDVKGLFLPDDVTIEASGLRIGPNSLKRIDPFQLLANDLTYTLLDRNRSAKESPDTAVVFCSNFGGAMPMHVSRMYAFLLKREEYGLNRNIPEMEKLLQWEMSSEELVSSLTVMFSGYPSSSFNLRAMHQTISGGAGIFWTSLVCAPYWLTKYCKSLLLGAGHLIKSPVDLSLYTEGEKNTKPLGEGFGVFLLKGMEQAMRDQDRILAVIKAIVPAQNGETLDKACKAAKIDPDSVDIHEISQLSPLASENVGDVDSLSVFMGEAAGIEVLSRILLGSGKMAALEVYNGGKKCWTLFIEKTGRYEQKPREVKIPLKIRFQKELNSCGIVKSDIPPVRSGERGGAWEMAVLTAWQQYINTIMKSSLTSRRKALLLLNQSRNEYAPGKPRRKPANLVIDSVSFSGGRYHAGLRVDEAHAFFFDHPLDHVPGILMMEGIFQLADTVLAGNRYFTTGGGSFIRALEMKFLRFCEKDLPVTVNLRLNPPGRDGSENLFAEVEQKGQAVCTAVLTAARTTSHKKGDSMRAVATGKTARPELTHKKNKGNVMVTAIESLGGQKYSCRVIPPGKEHICCDGDAYFYSPLFLLEVTRQFAIQLTHLVHEIPFDRMINLISVTMNLLRPACRNSNLRMEYEKQPIVCIHQNTIIRVLVKLLDQDGRIGECGICGQAVDPVTYRQQRFAGKS